MPDYTIDPYEYPEDECALCGAMDDLVGGHGRAEQRGGRTRIPLCRSCNSSMYDYILKGWLRRLHEEGHWKWDDILEHQRWKRTELARVVRQVRDE